MFLEEKLNIWFNDDCNEINECVLKIDYVNLNVEGVFICERGVWCVDIGCVVD